ncbi:hypothetical protein TNCV_3356631 [Trichonephila clavipes]|nr:hypothetical protein TNCV_3356631 [Trichonephila clavipes]
MNSSYDTIVPEPDETSNLVEEVVDLAWQIYLEVDTPDDVQELLDSHNKELAIDEPIEMREIEQDIEESLDPVQLEQGCPTRSPPVLSCSPPTL